MHMKSDPTGKEGVARGELADSRLVLRLMQQEIGLLQAQATQLVFIDGFPRKVEELTQWVEMFGNPSTAVYFDTDDELVVERLINRRVCDSCGFGYNLLSTTLLPPLLPAIPGKCDHCKAGKLIMREDDAEDTIRRRLKLARESEAPIHSRLNDMLGTDNVMHVDTTNGRVKEAQIAGVLTKLESIR